MFAPTPPPPWGGRADCSAIRYFHREIASQQVFGLKPAGTANSGPRWARLRPARLQEKPQHVSANVAANIRNLYCNNYGYEVASLRRPKAAARAALRAAICRRKFLRCLFNSIYQSAPPFCLEYSRPPSAPSGRPRGLPWAIRFFRLSIRLEICGCIKSRCCIALGDATFGCSLLRREPRSSRR